MDEGEDMDDVAIAAAVFIDPAGDAAVFMEAIPWDMAELGAAGAAAMPMVFMAVFMEVEPAEAESRLAPRRSEANIILTDPFIVRGDENLQACSSQTTEGEGEGEGEGAREHGPPKIGGRMQEKAEEEGMGGGIYTGAP